MPGTDRFASARALAVLLLLAWVPLLAPTLGASSSSAALAAVRGLEAPCTARACAVVDSATDFIVARASLAPHARARQGPGRGAGSDTGRDLALAAHHASARARVATDARARVDRHTDSHLPTGEPSPHDATAPPAARPAA